MTAKNRTRYYVETWDTDKQEFTPQICVRKGPYSKWGLRKAIRKLRAMGYPCNYSSRGGRGGDGDPSVSIYNSNAS
jgi:hypothetical protein